MDVYNFKALMRILCYLTLSILALPSHAVLINEVYYDQPGVDGSDVFTELTGSSGTDLSGWRLVGVNGSNGNPYRSIELSGAIIPADGILVISTITANSMLAAATDFTANVDWQNGPDAIQLYNSENILIDAFQYGTAPGFSAGEGLAATDVSAGRSLSRSYLGADTNNNSNDFLVLDTPTPGQTPLPTAPAITAISAPQTNTLLMCGLLLLMSRKRGRR